MEPTLLRPGIYRLPGSVCGGLLVREGHGLLIDAPELPAGLCLDALLSAAGVHTVDGVLLTQHRRAHSGGLARWTGPLPPVRCPAAEAPLLEQADLVWTSGRGKYHRYDCLPDRFSPLCSVPTAEPVEDGVPIRWRGLTITPVVFAAQSLGDCAYLVDDGSARIAFCGALAMAGGRIHDVYSFQKALPDMMGYHGFLGGLPAWLDGVRRLRALRPTLLAPAYGPVEEDPAGALALLERRLREYAERYDRISAVRYYFPAEFRRGFEEPLGLSPAAAAPTAEHPAWLSRIGETTSYLLRAPSGRGLLIDAGDREAVDAVAAMLADGRLTGLDGCWITHYHDDHLNAMDALVHQLGCPVLSTAAVAEVIRRPWAWLLPALPDCSVKLRTVDDGASWRWEGFTLTAYHFPGQTIHHAGLLVRRDGVSVLLCGDSFAPTGLDDYCADNRNLTGRGRGYRRCLALLRHIGPCLLVNEHQTLPFVYDSDFLAFLERGVDDREAALAQLLPGDIGFGVDSQWMRCWPAEQTVTAGSTLRLSVQLTGHGRHTVALTPRLPWGPPPVIREAVTDGLTTGSASVDGPELPADRWLHFDCPLPPEASSEYRIPFDCWLDGAYLGSYVTALVRVLPAPEA